MSFNKNGIVCVDTDSSKYIINNFTKTGVTTDWNLGGTLVNGTAVLTGTAPTIYSSSFNVGATDIIVFEFTVSVPTPSTTTDGPGLYLGTRYGDSTTIYWYDFTNNRWWPGSTVTPNAYFFHSYNSTTVNKVKTYILGPSADLSLVPPAERTATSHSIAALRISGSTTNIRSAYNSNTSMVIHFSNPKIYRINQMGICENTSTKSVAPGYLSFDKFMEY